jgi:hypothetical protein
MGDERALPLYSSFQERGKARRFCTASKYLWAMVQHGAVLQDNSNTRLRQHRLASSCYNFQKNARVVYLLYTAVF